MKQVRLSVLFLLLVCFAKGQDGRNGVKTVEFLDTSNYFHIGIIPYQVLTRSSGIYIRYDFKKFAIEYRPTYTYATNLVPGENSPPILYENFYFQGINNSFLFYRPRPDKTKIGFIFSYKHWWHSTLPIYNDLSVIPSKSLSGAYLIENKSTVMNGICTGVEFMSCNRKYNRFDCNFFFDATITGFIVQSQVYSAYAANYGFSRYFNLLSYPYDQTKFRFYFNITAGFKFGYRKQLTNK
ncbi:MAG TPA: hypothetical protein VF411_04155 [Bacteroidia bacterium]